MLAGLRSLMRARSGLARSRSVRMTPTAARIRYPSARAGGNVAPTIAVSKLALSRSTGNVADNGARCSTNGSANSCTTHIIRDSAANHGTRRRADPRALLGRCATCQRQTRQYACHQFRRHSLLHVVRSNRRSWHQPASCVARTIVSLKTVCDRHRIPKPSSEFKSRGAVAMLNACCESKNLPSMGRRSGGARRMNSAAMSAAAHRHEGRCATRRRLRRWGRPTLVLRMGPAPVVTSGR